MQKAKWIWTKTPYTVDDYAEFYAKFNITQGNVVLSIACDSVYNVFLNGRLVAFNACADYPALKNVDRIDITKYCEKDNEIKICVWHFGIDTSTCVKDTAGVIFEVAEDEEVRLYSDKRIKSRIMNEYKNGLNKLITIQLGQSFYYDNAAEKSNYSDSVEVDKNPELRVRPLCQMRIEERLPIKITPKDGYYLIDMGKEAAGFLELDFSSGKKQELRVCYGEHLLSGKVSVKTGERDFSVGFFAKEGENKYINTFRRIAGRYLEVYSKEKITINYIGIRPVFYPAVEIKKAFNDELLQRIYDVSVYTLRLCMHEHYEDCPWREQALYTLDSRNQMLCGYYAFKGYDYQRENLVLISKSLRNNGLLAICSPMDSDLAIPSFSLYFIMQLAEYVRYSGDKTILDEVGGVAKTIYATFLSKIDDNGLIASFPYPFWNFYEWAEDSSNDWQISKRTAETEYIKSYDLILNCLFVYVSEYYKEIFGEAFDTKEMKEKIKKTFFNGKVFKLTTETNSFSQVGQAFAILIGLGDKNLAKEMLSGEMIKATLSMKPFVYDALLTFGEEFKDYIIEDIKTTYAYMLRCGATTFWETEKGAEDFDGAGSLCHGWSAMPVYYLNVLGGK